MWTFYAWFLKKVDLNLKNVDLYTFFSEKSRPRPENVDLFMHDFLKKVDLNLKNVDLYAWFLKKVDLDLKIWTFYVWFSEKSGPQPENVDLLHMIFWKKWTSDWKCWPFTHEFLKKLDLNLKMWTFTHDFLKKVDLSLKMWTFDAWFSEKGGPQPKKCGPFCIIFWNKWTHDFLKKGDLNLKNVDLYA